MCLHDASQQKIADDDIVVYKVLQREKSLFWFTKYISPFRSSKWKVGKVVSSKLNYYEGCSFYSSDGMSVFTITESTVEAGLHSIVELEDAVRLRLEINHDFRYNHDFVIGEFVIPKGSAYHEGTFSGFKSIASDKLKLVKILELPPPPQLV